MSQQNGNGQWSLEDDRPYLLLLARMHLGARLRGKVGASDLVQETLLKAHKHQDQYRGRTQAERRAWLRRILVNTLADQAGKFGREPQIQQALEASSARLDSCWPLKTNPRPASTCRRTAVAQPGRRPGP